MTRGGRAARVLLAAAALATVLAACGRRHDRSAAASDAPSASSHGAAEDRASSEADKLNAYIEGYNTLIGTFGLQQQYAQYLGQRIAQKSVNDPVFVNIGWLDNAVGDLKKARATPGRSPELDAAGDQMLAVMGPLSDQLKALNVYYESRGQLADGFARGKREDPQVIARYQQAIADLPRLSDAIEKVQDRRDAAELVVLKREGDTIGYDHGVAMRDAKQLVDLTDTPAALADPARMGRADALVAEMQSALTDEAQAKARKPSGDIDHGLRDSMYESSADRLQGLIGRYRDLRRTPTPFARQAMVAAFNDAVEQANMAR